MLSVETVGVTLVGYLLGSIPFGVIIAKRNGVDIFSVGSGNPGATNVLRTIGKPAGYAVFILDFLKGIASHDMVFISYGIFFWGCQFGFVGITWSCSWSHIPNFLTVFVGAKEWQVQWVDYSELCLVA